MTIYPQIVIIRRIRRRTEGNRKLGNIAAKVVLPMLSGVNASSVRH
jgi:hypothetical protein